MSQARSPSADRPYGLALVSRVWRVPRSTVYAHRARKQSALVESQRKSQRRGPRGAGTDAELVDQIHTVLRDSRWVGEGYRKVWARLRHRGVRTAARRVLRLMREQGLQAPSRVGHPHGPKAHDGTIIPDRPNELWGTDMTTTLTHQKTASIFFVIDHCTAECLGIHATDHGTRLEALEPLRQAVRRRFGTFTTQVAGGTLGLRHDHGSQFMSDFYQEELRFLGIRSTPAFIGEPEGNGCAERFVRTLKEQLLWLFHFPTIQELNAALQAFRERYNHTWLIQRHGYRTPDEHRRALEVAA